MSAPIFLFIFLSYGHEFFRVKKELQKQFLALMLNTRSNFRVIKCPSSFMYFCQHRKAGESWPKLTFKKLSHSHRFVASWHTVACKANVRLIGDMLKTNCTNRWSYTRNLSANALQTWQIFESAYTNIHILR